MVSRWQWYYLCFVADFVVIKNRLKLQALDRDQYKSQIAEFPTIVGSLFTNQRLKGL